MSSTEVRDDAPALRTVFVTAPDVDVAKTLARTLVDERLAACVNVLPGVCSIYRWEGNVQEDAEVLLMIKTREDRCAALAERVAALHPYDVPEVLALPVVDGSRAYLDWVAAEVTS